MLITLMTVTIQCGLLRLGMVETCVMKGYRAQFCTHGLPQRLPHTVLPCCKWTGSNVLCQLCQEVVASGCCYDPPRGTAFLFEPR